MTKDSGPEARAAAFATLMALLLAAGPPDLTTAAAAEPSVQHLEAIRNAVAALSQTTGEADDQALGPDYAQFFNFPNFPNFPNFNNFNNFPNFPNFPNMFRNR